MSKKMMIEGLKDCMSVIEKPIHSESGKFLGIMCFDVSNINITAKSNGQFGIHFANAITIEHDGKKTRVESAVIHTGFKKGLREKSYAECVNIIVTQLIEKLFRFPQEKTTSNGVIHPCWAFSRKNREKDIGSFAGYCELLFAYFDSDTRTANEIQTIVGMIMEYLRFDYTIGQNMSEDVRDILKNLIESTSLKNYPDLAFVDDDTLYFKIYADIAPFVIEENKGRLKRVRQNSSTRMRFVSSLMN